MLNSFGEGKLLTENLPVDCGGVTLVERPTGVSLKQEALI